MSSPSSSRAVLRFGPFEIDREEQQLRKSGILVRIQPQPFKVLTALVARRGETVTREELRRELWGDQTFVDFEQGLNYCIRQIRTVLSDDAQSPLYIETIPRRGYRFIGPVEELEDPVRAKAAPPASPAPKEGRIPRWVLVSALLVIVIPAGVWLLIRSVNRPSLTERDSILITEFSNTTGDPLFDGTLRRAVSVDLGQSPYLNVVSDDRIRQVLGLMSKPADSRITPEVGREICLRSGTKAMLTGSISPLENQYLLTLEVLNAGSGDLLAEERVQVSARDQVLTALGKAADQARKKLGESLASIQQFGKPLEQVTTPSLEALQAYTLGMEKRRESDYDSVPFFQRAIELDPNFALAHASLGAVYLNLEQLPLAEEHEKKAMALTDRVTERERLYITAHYYLLIGQIDKLILTYETYARQYPRDWVPEVNLATEYNGLGRYDKALGHALKALRLNSDNPGNIMEAANAYLGLERIAEAKAEIAEGLKHNPDSSGLHLALSNIALAEGDEATRNREDAQIRSTPSGNLNLLYRDAALAASRGRLREAQRLYDQAVGMAQKLGLKDNASFAWALRAVYESYLEKPSDAIDSARNALKLSQMSDTIEPAAFALARAGAEHQAESLIDNLANQRPDDEMVRFVWAPAVHALASLNHGDPEAAIRMLGPAIPYDRGSTDVMLVRANAFLKAGHAADAVEEFRRITLLRNYAPSDPACALAQLGLARAYDLTGQKAKSEDAYRAFLGPWKGADSDSTILQRATAEFAELQ